MTLDKLTSALNKGGQHLGDLIWWTLAEARIDRSNLETIWASAQLAPDHLPEPPTAEKALKAAVRETAIGQPDRLIRLGKEDEAEVVFAVVRETKHADGSISYSQETRVILDRRAETVSTDVPGHDLAGVIATRFSELRTTHTADDVRRAMMKTLDGCAAVTLRDHGGVYWAEADGSRIVEVKLKKGDVLFVLDARPFQAHLDVGEAALIRVAGRDGTGAAAVAAVAIRRRRASR